MNKRDIPIRSRIEMVKDVAKILHYLHEGQRQAADFLIEDLKARSIFLSELIQQDVLSFAEQVQFQYDYDPWHKVTRDVQMAADKLIKDLA